MLTMYKVKCTSCGAMLLRIEDDSGVEVKCSKCKKLFNVKVRKGDVTVSLARSSK